MTESWDWTRAAQEYLAAERIRRRPGGVRAYEKVLGRLERHAAGRPLDAEVVMAYLATRVGLALTTISFEMTVIQSFERWVKRRGHPVPSLLAYVDRPRKVKRPPLQAPRAEVAKAAAWCQSDLGWPRSRRFVGLCLYAGLRFTEARLLDWSDVDELAGELLVRDGKGGAARHIPIAAPLARLFGEVPRSERVGAVAGLASGEPLARGGAEKIFSVELPRFGIRLSAHMLRRAFATRIDELGHSLKVTQELLGHSSLATTERYIGVDHQRKVAAVGDLDGAFDEAALPCDQPLPTPRNHYRKLPVTRRREPAAD